jgi:hypothetical protein
MVRYLSCARCLGMFNLVYVSFQLLLGVTTQFPLPFDLLKEFQDLRSYGTMTA